MNNKNIFEDDFIKKLIIYSLIFFGIFLRIFFFNYSNDYYDDWNFFFTVDPTISNELTWVRYYGDRRILEQYNSYDWSKVGEDFPYYFAFLTKFILKIIGYSVEKIHYLVLFFSICSLLFISKICDLITKNIDFKVLTIFLFATNFYLIKDLNALRPHSLTILLTLLSLYYFIQIFFKNKITKKNLFLYYFLTLFYLLIWPLNLAFFAAQLIILFFIFFNEKKNKKIIFASTAIILISYIVMNYDYLQYQVINKSDHYTPLEIKFFYSYFFNMFFGSIFFGAFMLLIFAYFFVKDLIKFYNFGIFNIKSLFIKNNIINIFLTITVVTYILLIFYSILRAPVMAAKYIPFVVPIIIIWISYKIIINKKRLIIYSLIFLSLINFYFYWDYVQIDRPPVKRILKLINNSDVNKIFTTEGYVFNHHLNHYDISLTNNLSFQKFDDYNYDSLPSNFWFLCLNNPRFRVGDNSKIVDDKKCYSFTKYKNLKIITTKKIPDIIIHKIKKIK